MMHDHELWNSILKSTSLCDRFEKVDGLIKTTKKYFILTGWIDVFKVRNAVKHEDLKGTFSCNLAEKDTRHGEICWLIVVLNVDPVQAGFCSLTSLRLVLAWFTDIEKRKWSAEELL